MNHTSGFFELLLVAFMVGMLFFFVSGKSCSELLDFSSVVQVYPK